VGIEPQAMLIRSGTGVIWGNTVISGTTTQVGYTYMALFTVYRAPACGGPGNQFGPPWNETTGSNPWDGNTLSNGYPALDQVGYGTCLDQIRGNPPLNRRTGTAAWPRNQAEPIYEWNNTWNPVPNNGGSKLGFECDIVQSGRDVMPDTPMSGYTPYVYPHPFQGVSPTPTPSPGPSPTPTATPTATSTPTATATAMAAATATATIVPPPIPSPTPTATATPQHTPRPHPSHGPG
jgi:hypothetical protein